MVYENYWRAKSGTLLSHHERWKKQADAVGLSAEGRLRLEWIIYAELSGNVSQTCRRFGISTSVFYKWKGRFDQGNVKTLESRSRSPQKRCSRESVPLIDERVIVLRKRYMYWGKMKLQTLYMRENGEYLSSWYIQRVIEKKVYLKEQRGNILEAKVQLQA